MSRVKHAAGRRISHVLIWKRFYFKTNFCFHLIFEVFNALKWLKINNPRYADINIDEHFQLIGTNQSLLSDSTTDSESLLVRDTELEHHGLTDMNPQLPAGTAVEQYLLKDMRGQIFPKFVI